MNLDVDGETYAVYSFDDDESVELVEKQADSTVRGFYIVDDGEVVERFSGNQPNIALDFGEGYVAAKERYSGEDPGMLHRVISRLGSAL